jgi:hypothetical protein
MRRPLIPLLTTALVALLSVSAPLSVRPAGAAVSDRVTLVGLTTDDKLVTFTTDGPGTFLSTVAVTGLATGEHLVDIGFRPAGAGLYGVGTTSRFDIDVTPSGNIGLAALTVGGTTKLYSVDLSTGKATDQGKIGDGTASITGLTIAPSVGYWLTTNSGTVAGYGDADPLGSAAALSLTKPIVGIAASPSGEGFWLVASDGGIFSFVAEGTKSRFYGSGGSITLAQPIVGMAATHTGAGYWIVAADGGIFAYGDASPVGSAASRNSPTPWVGMAAA